MDFDAFRADPKTVAAVERKLLVISEAASRLSEQAEMLCPGLAWRDIRGIGNWLRHQYDRVDLATIWQTVRIWYRWNSLYAKRCQSGINRTI